MGRALSVYGLFSSSEARHSQINKEVELEPDSKIILSA